MDLFDIYVVNTGWGTTSWLVEDTPEKKWIEERIVKTVHYANSGGQFDINLQVTIPNEVEKHAPINILYTAGIETTKVSPEWLNVVNEIDKVIVVSNHSKQVFEMSEYRIEHPPGTSRGLLKCTTDIDVVNYPVKKVKKCPVPDLGLSCDFNFLTMAQWGPRKDLETVIKGFLAEFWAEDVGLVVKTFIGNNSLIDRVKTTQGVENLIEQMATYLEGTRECKIHLLHGNMTDEELHAVYKHSKIKAFVTTTHGEGFGLSIFESAYSALPVIAPGWSGQCDYLFKGEEPYFTGIKYTIQQVGKNAVWNTVVQEDSMWAYVDPKDFREKLRHVYLNHDEVKAKAEELAKHLKKEWTVKVKNAEFVESVLSVLPDNSEIRDDDIESWLNDMDINLVEVE